MCLPIIGSIAILVLVLLTLLAFFLPRRMRRYLRNLVLPSQESRRRKAFQLFVRQQSELQSQFFELARRQGKPRGLIWTHTEWKEETAFARDLETGLLTALVSLEIHFSAIPGGDMEDVEAVSHFRQASAVFHHRNGVWGTGGRALFNLTPGEAMTRLEGQFEPLSDQGTPV